MDRRTRHINEIARDLVKSRVKVHFMRDGKLIEAVPTLKEARQVAEDIETLLDAANGDVQAQRLMFGKPH